MKRSELIDKISQVHEAARHDGMTNESFAYILVGLGLGIIDSEFGRQDAIKRLDQMRTKLVKTAPSLH